jgi:hypothetical protein
MKFNVVFFDNPRFLTRLLGWPSLTNVFRDSNLWNSYVNFKYGAFGKILKVNFRYNYMYQKESAVLCVTIDDNDI